MRLTNNGLLGFVGALVLLVGTVAVLGRTALAPPRHDLRLVDATGAIAISNDREGQAVLSASGLVPGRTVRGRVTVAAGSSALTLSETPPIDTPGPGGGRLSQRLALRVEDVTDPSAPRTIFTGPLAGLTSTALGAAPGGGARTYEFAVTFSDTAGANLNAYMASSASVGFQWDASADGTPQGYPGQVAADNPLAYWDLGGGAGPADRIGGHDGTFANGVTTGTAGVAGDHTAAWFDGASGYAYVNGIAAPQHAYTLEAWIHPDHPGDMAIVEQGGAGALVLRGGKPVFHQTDTDVTAPSALSLGWHHVAATWDGRTARLYVDGAIVASAASSTRPSGAATLYIGYGAQAPWFAGTIDGVAYYPTALAADRIAAHFHAVTAPAADAPSTPSAPPTQTTSTGTPAPPIAVASDTTRPRLSALHVGSQTRVTYRISERASLVFTLQRVRTGARPRTVGSFTRTATRGPHRLALPTSLRKRLSPGRYRLRVIATDRAGNRSAAVSTTFRVRR